MPDYFYEHNDDELHSIVAKQKFEIIPFQKTGSNDSDMGFKGKLIRCAYVLGDESYVRITQNGQFKGMDVDILKIMAQRLNFTIQYLKTEDGTYGARDANGHWVGMVGMLHRNEADIAIPFMEDSPDRRTAVDLTMGVYVERCLSISFFFNYVYNYP